VDSRILSSDIVCECMMCECMVFIGWIIIELEVTSVCQDCFHFIVPFILTAKRFRYILCMNVWLIKPIM